VNNIKCPWAVSRLVAPAERQRQIGPGIAGYWELPGVDPCRQCPKTGELVLTLFGEYFPGFRRLLSGAEAQNIIGCAG